MSKDYIRPMPKTWWLTRPTWRWFMLREWTALFVAAYAVFLVFLVSAARNTESFAAFCECLSSPWSIVFHVLVFAMATYHTITWFAAAPKALRVYRGEERVPEHLVAGGHFGAWFVVSAIVAWIVLG